jgi:polar amino acid transport system substrate-binding protein
MRSKLSVLFAALLLCVVAAVAHADPVMQRATARGHFVAAVQPDQLPFAARDAAGKLTGFDVEVAEEIGRRLGLPVTLAAPGWAAILSGKWDGKVDYAVASITPTPARAEKLSFPVLYRMDAAVVVVRKDDKRFERPQDVSGKTVAVKGKTTFERYLRKELGLDELGGAIAYVIENAKIATFPGKDEALAALAQKKADAMVTSRATAEAAQKDGQPIRILPGFLYFEPIAVATAKGDPEFDARLSAAVEAMRADGTLSKLSVKWFGIDLGTIVP